MWPNRFRVLMLDPYGGVPADVGHARITASRVLATHVEACRELTIVLEHPVPARAVLKIHDSQAYAGSNPYVRGRIAAGEVEPCPEHGYQHAEDMGAHGIGCAACLEVELAAENAGAGRCEGCRKELALRRVFGHAHFLPSALLCAACAGDAGANVRPQQDEPRRAPSSMQRFTLRASDNVRPDVLDEGAHERGEAECALRHHMSEARGGR